MELAYEKLIKGDITGRVEESIKLNKLNIVVKQETSTPINESLSIWLHQVPNEEMISFFDLKTRKRFFVEYTDRIWGRKIIIGQSDHKIGETITNKIDYSFGYSYLINDKVFDITDDQETVDFLKEISKEMIENLDYQNVSEADLIQNVLTQFVYEQTNRIIKSKEKQVYTKK